MSDQISEKMARKLARQVAGYAWYTQADQSDTESRFIGIWRAAGLIKKSALDEAREWVRDVQPAVASEYSSYYNGVCDAAERFEAAITEILEERE